MLADLTLENFRSYRKASFEFSPNVNIIVGPNASGKTNLLEAVLVVSRGKSYRVKDSELIQFNKDWAKLSSTQADNGTRIVKLNPDKTFVINGKEYKRLPQEKTLPAVLFEPNHLQLLSGGPERRRDYLDDLIEQITVDYNKLRRQYSRALSQRNNLLKQPNLNKNHVFPWNIKLSHLAGQIVRERVNLSNELNKNLESLYKELSGDKIRVEFKYNNQWPPDVYETNLLKGLEKDLELDIIKGFTSLGPHREDFEVTLNNHNSQLVASRGEIRTIVLSLKILELHIIEKTREAKPILLLDDVFSELDGVRRHTLTDHLNYYQTFITITDADIVLKHLAKRHSVIFLE